MHAQVNLRRADVNSDAVQSVDEHGRVFAVLVTEQKQVGEAIVVTHMLYWFDSEKASTDLSSGSAMNLEDVEAINTRDSTTLVLQTDSSWQVELTPDGKLDGWLAALRSHCVNIEGYVVSAAEVTGGGGGGTAAGAAASSGRMLESGVLRMIVPRQSSGALSSGGVWHTFDCELSSSGTLSYRQTAADAARSPAAAGWEKGSIDVRKAIGVWLLGTAGAPTLDIILPGRKYTLAPPEGETGAQLTLSQWRKSIEALMPHKPVQELKTGWLEKMGEGTGAGWKVR